MAASLQQQVVDGGVVVVFLLLQRLFGLDRIDAEALHQPQDLLVGLVGAGRRGGGGGGGGGGSGGRVARGGVGGVCDDGGVAAGRFVVRHPPVALDLAQQPTARRFDDQHFADQRFAICAQTGERAVTQRPALATNGKRRRITNTIASWLSISGRPRR